MFPCVWLHFKKIFGKYFLVFGKEEGKHKSIKTQATTQKKIINDEKSSPTTAIRDCDRRRDRDLAFFARSRSTARSCEGEIAILRSVDRDIGSSSLAYIRDLTIDASRDHAVDRDLDPVRSREGKIAINGAISRRRDRDQWRLECLPARLRSARSGDRDRARALSLSFSRNT